MRWIGPLAVLLAFSSSALRTTAGELAQAHPVLSGFATNALVRAYHASGLDTNISAPLRLRSYVVTIYTSGDDWIMFNDTASMEVHNILVAARTASVVWRAGDPGGEVYSNPTTTEALMLPGVVAVEIILAYREGSRGHYNLFRQVRIIRFSRLGPAGPTSRSGRRKSRHRSQSIRLQPRPPKHVARLIARLRPVT